jgi:hypothetical protein
VNVLASDRRRYGDGGVIEWRGKFGEIGREHCGKGWVGGAKELG